MRDRMSGVAAARSPLNCQSARKRGSDSHLMILRGGVALVCQENQRHGEHGAISCIAAMEPLEEMIAAAIGRHRPQGKVSLPAGKRPATKARFLRLNRGLLIELGRRRAGPERER
jgi:hypothetical protein